MCYNTGHEFNARFIAAFDGEFFGFRGGAGDG